MARTSSACQAVAIARSTAKVGSATSAPAHAGTPKAKIRTEVESLERSSKVIVTALLQHHASPQSVTLKLICTHATTNLMP